MFNPDMFFLQVFGMSTKWEVEQMMDDDRIYLSNNTNEAEDCLLNDDCNQLGRLLSGTGCHQISLNKKIDFFVHQGQQGRYRTQSTLRKDPPRL